jgi:hypothetical protein
MGRSARISVAVLALLLLVVGSALANRSPVADEHRSPVAASQEPSPGAVSDKSDTKGSDADEAEDAADTTPPSQPQLDRLVGLLKTAGITATDEQLTALIAKYGVGGAMRVLAWAHDGDTSQVTALRDQGLGWGEIARQLNEADPSANLGPGIGWIMSGGHGAGHGGGHAEAANATGHGSANGKASAPGQADQP